VHAGVAAFFASLVFGTPLHASTLLSALIMAASAVLYTSEGRSMRGVYADMERVFRAGGPRWDRAAKPAAHAAGNVGQAAHNAQRGAPCDQSEHRAEPKVPKRTARRVTGRGGSDEPLPSQPAEFER
jgi:hypothetical protein